jgi:hypothetical protein
MPLFKLTLINVELENNWFYFFFLIYFVEFIDLILEFESLYFNLLTAFKKCNH